MTNQLINNSDQDNGNPSEPISERKLIKFESAPPPQTLEELRKQIFEQQNVAIPEITDPIRMGINTLIDDAKARRDLIIGLRGEIENKAFEEISTDEMDLPSQILLLGQLVKEFDQETTSLSKLTEQQDFNSNEFTRHMNSLRNANNKYLNIENLKNKLQGRTEEEFNVALEELRVRMSQPDAESFAKKKWAKVDSFNEELDKAHIDRDPDWLKYKVDEWKFNYSNTNRLVKMISDKPDQFFADLEEIISKMQVQYDDHFKVKRVGAPYFGSDYILNNIEDLSTNIFMREVGELIPFEELGVFIGEMENNTHKTREGEKSHDIYAEWLKNKLADIYGVDREDSTTVGTLAKNLLPYSLNVPYNVFRYISNRPAELARVKLEQTWGGILKEYDDSLREMGVNIYRLPRKQSNIIGRLTREESEDSTATRYLRDDISFGAVAFLEDEFPSFFQETGIQKDLAIDLEGDYKKFKSKDLQEYNFREVINDLMFVTDPEPQMIIQLLKIVGQESYDHSNSLLKADIFKTALVLQKRLDYERPEWRDECPSEQRLIIDLLAHWNEPRYVLAEELEYHREEGRYRLFEALRKDERTEELTSEEYFKRRMAYGSFMYESNVFNKGEFSYVHIAILRHEISFDGGNESNVQDIISDLVKKTQGSGQLEEGLADAIPEEVIKMSLEAKNKDLALSLETLTRLEGGRPLKERIQSIKEKQRTAVREEKNDRKARESEVLNRVRISLDVDAGSSSQRLYERTLDDGSYEVASLEDTQTRIEYGKHTWTTEQSVRDILQNHLDIGTELFVQDLASRFILFGDTPISEVNLDELLPSEVDEYNDIVFQLYTLYKALNSGNLSPDLANEFLLKLERTSISFNFAPAYFNGNILDSQRLAEDIQEMHIALPEVRYELIDLDDPANTRSVTMQEMLEDDALNEQTADGKYKFQIQAVVIADQGTGFDSKLSTVYKSTKAGKRYLRGKFGEGQKMSFIHILRNGGDVELQSAYLVASENGQKQRISWKSKPFVDEDQKVKVNQLSTHSPNLEGNTGTTTRLDFTNMTDDIRGEFQGEFDPRNGRFQYNVRDFSESSFTYPYLSEDSGFTIGVSKVDLSNGEAPQYVHGLRVPSADMPIGREHDSSRFGFSYDFLDSDRIAGRDRNAFRGGLKGMAKSFWTLCNDQDLIADSIDLVINDKSGMYVETEIIADILSSQSPAKIPYTQTLIKALNLEDGVRYYFVDRAFGDEEKALKEKATAMGYTIVELPRRVVYRLDYQNLNEITGRNLDVKGPRTFEESLNQQEFESSFSVETEGTIKEIVDRARVSLEATLQELLPTAQLRFLGDIEIKVGTPGDKPMQLNWHSTNRTFNLVVRPQFIDFDNVEYLEKMIEVQLLGAVNREGFFGDSLGREDSQAYREQMLHAQDIANLILIAKANNIPSIVDQLNPELLSKHINEEISVVDELKPELDIPEDVIQAGLLLMEDAQRFSLTADRATEVIGEAKDLPPFYKERVFESLESRIIIDPNTQEFVYFTGSNMQRNFDLIRISFDQAKTDNLIGGKPVYKVGRSLVLRTDTDNLTSIEVDKEKGKELVIQGDRVYEVDSTNAITSHTFGSSLSLENGLVGLRIPNYGDEVEKTAESLQNLIESMDRAVFRYGDTEREDMNLLQGIIESPISIDYGVDEWNNPIRVFQDVIQNHIDASGGDIKILYIVDREGERVRITADEVNPDDELFGLVVQDNGGGYNPDNIGTMGYSSKSSPLSAGRYGEGLKMISAAAVRLGMNLTFSSTGFKDGQRYRWNAQALAIADNFYDATKAQKSNFDRLGYKLSSQEDEETAHTSETILELPKGTSISDAGSQWEEWIKIFHPHQGTTHKGLARYAIQLRDKDWKDQNLVTIGPSRIILDPAEAGKVYENGLFVAESENLAMGWDVPRITKTRERNLVMQNRLSDRVRMAMESLTDERVIEKNIVRFVDRALEPKGIQGKRDMWDIKPARRNNTTDPSIAAPIWYAAFRRLYPGIVLSMPLDTCRKEYTGAVAAAERAKREGTLRPGADIQKLYRLMNARHHTESSRLLDVDRADYYTYSQVVPNLSDLTGMFSGGEREVDPEILDNMAQMTLAAVRHVGLTADLLESQPNLLGMLSLSDEPDEKIRLEQTRERILERVKDWEEDPKVFIMRRLSALGLAKQGRIGYNEMLLNEGISQLSGVAIHEAIHDVLHLPDYEPEFIAMLLQSARM